MRDVRIDPKLLTQALARSAQPLHRFRDARPANKTRTPVAFAAPALVRDGVAKLRLYDVIDSWGGDWGVSASEFVDALDALPDDVQRIDLHVNSPGGEVWEGLAIMNTLRQHGAPVRAVVDGLAASAASFIAVAADELVMGQNTRLMIHDAMGIAMGNAADMHSFGDWLSDLSDEIASIYASKAGGPAGAWRAAMLEETWYTADEAVTAGLADSVAGAEPPAEETDAPAAAARFDLTAVGARYADRDNAPAPKLPTATDTDEDTAATMRAQQIRHQRNRHRLNAARMASPTTQTPGASASGLDR